MSVSSLLGEEECAVKVSECDRRMQELTIYRIALPLFRFQRERDR